MFIEIVGFHLHIHGMRCNSNKWCNNYTNVGRANNSIDCLTEVLGMSFNQAVYSLTGRDVTNMRSSDFPKKQAPQYTSPPRAVQTENLYS